MMITMYRGGKSVVSHSFRGKTFEIILANDIRPGDSKGFTESRRKRKPRMVLSGDVIAFKLELCVHEALHACFPKLTVLLREDVFNLALRDLETGKDGEK